MTLEQAGIQSPPDNRRHFSQREIMAMRAANLLSQELIDGGRTDEIVQVYRQSILPGEELLSLEDIGKMIVPDDFHTPGVKANAVRIVINASSLDSEEREAIDARRRTLFAEKRIKETGPEGVAERLERARQVHSANIRNGTTLVNSTGIVEGMGHTRWSEIEKTLLRLTANSTEFRYGYGVHKGQPDWDKITKFVNDAFHDGIPVRSRQALVHEYYGHTKNRKRKK